MKILTLDYTQSAVFLVSSAPTANFKIKVTNMESPTTVVLRSVAIIIPTSTSTGYAIVVAIDSTDVTLKFSNTPSSVMASATSAGSYVIQQIVFYYIGSIYGFSSLSAFTAAAA